MSDWIDKAKDFVKGHPDQAQQGLDKAEELINERTGGQYAEKIDQGTDALKEQLGLPADGDAVPDGAQPPATPEPADPVEPATARGGGPVGDPDAADRRRAGPPGGVEPQPAGLRPGRHHARGPAPADLTRTHASAGGPVMAAGARRVLGVGVRGTQAPVASLISASTAPEVTVSPTAAVSPVTTPSLCAAIEICLMLLGNILRVMADRPSRRLHCDRSRIMV